MYLSKIWVRLIISKDLRTILIKRQNLEFMNNISKNNVNKENLDNLNFYFFLKETISKMKFEKENNTEIDDFIKRTFSGMRKFQIRDQKEFNQSMDNSEEQSKIFGKEMSLCNLKPISNKITPRKSTSSKGFGNCWIF